MLWGMYSYTLAEARPQLSAKKIPLFIFASIQCRSLPLLSLINNSLVKKWFQIINKLPMKLVEICINCRLGIDKWFYDEYNRQWVISDVTRILLWYWAFGSGQGEYKRAVSTLAFSKESSLSQAVWTKLKGEIICKKKLCFRDMKRTRYEHREEDGWWEGWRTRDRWKDDVKLKW